MKDKYDFIDAEQGKFYKPVEELDIPICLEKDKSKDLNPEYKFDYSKARPNRFAKQLTKNNITIELDPDVAQVFTSAEAVNTVLRALIQTMPHITPSTKTT